MSFIFSWHLIGLILQYSITVTVTPYCVTANWDVCSQASQLHSKCNHIISTYNQPVTGVLIMVFTLYSCCLYCWKSTMIILSHYLPACLSVSLPQSVCLYLYLCLPLPLIHLPWLGLVRRGLIRKIYYYILIGFVHINSLYHAPRDTRMWRCICQKKGHRLKTNPSWQL